MNLPILPMLAVCHRRQRRVKNGTYHYTYGLLAFPGPGVNRWWAPYCIAARRWFEPDGAGDTGKPPAAAAKGRGNDLLAVSDVFEAPRREALALFEAVAFAHDPVSPHHLQEVMGDLQQDIMTRAPEAVAAAPAGS